LIRAATGVDFNWPPDEATGAPEAAFNLALVRVRQATDGTSWRKLNPADLQDLHRMGVISQEFLDKALDYLSKAGGKGTDSVSSGAGSALKAAGESPAAKGAGSSGVGMTALYL
jgi:hypothetical protein